MQLEQEAHRERRRSVFDIQDNSTHETGDHKSVNPRVQRSAHYFQKILTAARASAKCPLDLAINEVDDSCRFDVAGDASLSRGLKGFRPRETVELVVQNTSYIAGHSESRRRPYTSATCGFRSCVDAESSFE